MDDATLIVVLGAALTAGLVHTALGPDHYLPFVAMSRAGRWSLKKTLLVTSACGIGHVLSSVVLGLVGLRLGAAALGLEELESSRGTLAGWLLLGFGLAYMIWGLRRAWRPAAPELPDSGSKKSGLTAWALFLIFVFGPCEPLIPLLALPAARDSLANGLLISAVFGAATLAMMLSLVAAGYFGLSRLASHPFPRYAHAASGAAVAACGLAMAVFGL